MNMCSCSSVIREKAPSTAEEILPNNPRIAHGPSMFLINAAIALQLRNVKIYNLMKTIGALFAVFLFTIPALNAQTLSPARFTDWSLAGHRGPFLEPDTTIDFIAAGGVNDGIAANDAVLSGLLSATGSVPAIIYFPSGVYLFTQKINITNTVILRGNSCDSTTFIFDFPSESDLIYVHGNTTVIETSITTDLTKDSTRLPASNATLFNMGDLIQLSENDSVLVTSSWALRTTGQIARIDTIIGNDIYIESPLRRNFYLSRNPKITKLNPLQDVGIENIKLLPTNATVAQTSNIVFQYAYNCWVKCIKSINCNYAHIEARTSSNIVVSGSYFQDAFSYGDGGKAYGIMIHSTSGECLGIGNIFKHLRHSMIFQSGANGNVFAYNYSREPYWTDVALPSNSAGDMVLHGNYPYANLFEGNIGQNIVIDDSHGKNGMYNTFFRNRAELYGIFMNNNPATDYVNFIGNDVPNTGFLLGQYTVFGTNHFSHGNNIRGTITPAGTSTLPENSLFLSYTPPYYLSHSHWPPLGTPTAMNAYNNEAENNYIAGQLTDCSLAGIIVSIDDNSPTEQCSIFPNPASRTITIEISNDHSIHEIMILSLTGQTCASQYSGNVVDVSQLKDGMYFIRLVFDNGTSLSKKFIKAP